MEIELFVRKPFPVEVVQITAENMTEVAEWCGGTVEHTDEEVPYVKVETLNPGNVRMSRGFVGTRVLKSSKGFKVYTKYPFDRDFEPAAAQSDPVEPGKKEGHNVFDRTPLLDSLVSKQVEWPIG